MLIINNDVIVEPNFLSPMIALAHGKEDAGIVTCAAYFQSNRRRFYCTAGRFSRLLCAGVPLSAEEQITEREVDYISGCILLVKRKVFETVGLLDERFFMYYEDLDFSERVKNKFKLLYTPKGVVYHKSGGGDRWDVYTDTYLYYTMRNRFWIFGESPTYYKTYVFLFSLVNASLKSAVIVIASLLKFRSNKTAQRLASIWRGVYHGIIHESVFSQLHEAL